MPANLCSVLASDPFTFNDKPIYRDIQMYEATQYTLKSEQRFKQSSLLIPIDQWCHIYPETVLTVDGFVPMSFAVTWGKHDILSNIMTKKNSSTHLFIPMSYICECFPQWHWNEDILNNVTIPHWNQWDNLVATECYPMQKNNNKL